MFKVRPEVAASLHLRCRGEKKLSVSVSGYVIKTLTRLMRCSGQVAGCVLPGRLAVRVFPTQRSPQVFVLAVKSDQTVLPRHPVAPFTIKLENPFLKTHSNKPFGSS